MSQPCKPCLQEDESHYRVLLEAIKNDTLRKLEKEKKETADKTILTAAKLIAPVIEATFAVGFDWCIEQVKESQYSELSNELEVTKGLTFLKQQDIPKVSGNTYMTSQCMTYSEESQLRLWDVPRIIHGEKQPFL